MPSISQDQLDYEGLARISRGQKLVIIPFTAGSGVVENDELERISLVVARGIAETISAHVGVLEVVDTENAAQADYILEGHITDIKDPGAGFLSFIGKDRQKSLAIEALVKDARTGSTIMQFVDRKDAQDNSVDIRQLALELGREFAQWLVAKVN